MDDDPDSSDIAIVIELREPTWSQTCAAPDVVAESAARAAFVAAPETSRLPRPVELGIQLADDALVRALNRDHRGSDRATNVLSFPTLDDCDVVALPRGQTLLLGDVVLAYETVAREAADSQKDVAAHLSHLVVHGVLHLLGYDHQEEKAAERMEALETRVLEGLGYDDPYDDTAVKRPSRATRLADAAQH